jgi:FkbM family methyltransferase
VDIQIEILRMRRRLIKWARKMVFGKPRNLAKDYLASVDAIGLVVHVGAHLGQEADVYRQLGATRVVWIEGDPETYARLMQRLQEAPRDGDRPIDQVVICALVSDVEGRTVAFHRFNNDGASSSVHLPTDRKKQRWPGLDTIGDAVELRTRTLESILDDVGIEPPGNAKSLLVLDVQGHELSVLAGIGRYARAFDLCECEVSKEAIYAGGALYPDVLAAFARMGYDLVSHDDGNVPWHGDVIFRRG